MRISRKNITASRDKSGYWKHTVDTVIDSLEAEYDFQVSHPDIDDRSVEFYYQIGDIGHTVYYVDDELNPELFELVDAGNIADAVEMMKAEVISNYVQEYGPIDNLADVSSATNTSGISNRAETIVAEDDPDDWLVSYKNSVEESIGDSIQSIRWRDDDGFVYADVLTNEDNILRFKVPKDELSFEGDVTSDADEMVNKIISECGIDSKVESAQYMDGTEYDPEDYQDGYTEWEEIGSKRVRDSDGFMTDYTMWYNSFEDKYVFVFGDKDIYYPENSDWDWECENLDEAQEWFDDYEGFEDDDDIYNCKDINASDELVQPTTASWVVRRMYNKFPECEFLDERDMGDDVALFFKLGGDVGKVEAWLNQIKNEYGLSYKIKDGKLRIIAPEDDDTIDECQTIESSTDDSEKPYLITFGWDEGGPESGPIWKSGTDIMYAKSEDEACKKWELEYAPQFDGSERNAYEGCWAREATQEEVDKYQEEQKRAEEEYEYMKSMGWLDDDYSIDECSDIKASDEFFDKGEDATYWYFTTHGVQPGSVPKGLEILDVVDKPEGSYFLTNKVLTTDSLKYYDIKERAPKGVTSSSEVNAWYVGEPDASEAIGRAMTDMKKDVDLDMLYEIADRYNSSKPLSGDWSTETYHEQKAISDELGVSMHKAKQLMIDELGFTEDMFDTISSSSVTGADDIQDESYVSYGKEDFEAIRDIYSSLMDVEDKIGQAEDFFFDYRQVHSALQRCYTSIEAAKKAIEKYNK